MFGEGTHAIYRPLILFIKHTKEKMTAVLGVKKWSIGFSTSSYSLYTHLKIILPSAFQKHIYNTRGVSFLSHALY